MPNGFIAIPDWFSHENQGADVAIASLENNGQNDLIVLMVDNAEGQNRGLYRVGKTLNGEGQVTGGWGPWIEIPGWFSWENQGAGIAAADLDNDGKLELIVLMVDSSAQQNRALLRIGRNLDAIGNVTGGWTPWMDIPDWFSWENQGAALTVTAPNAAGQRMLVVFMIDNGPQINRGLYRLGQNLTADGNVAAWTPWIDVPDWFWWENQDCGVAVADLDGNGTPDLVVFIIDNSVVQNPQNQGFFRIGHNMGADGNPIGGWTDWFGVPHWFSWENAGGGIDIARINGVHKLFVHMVDNPVGQNAGLYTVLDLDQDPAVYGKWEVLPFFSGVLGVHTAVLPTGKVMFFAGSGSSKVRFDSPDFGNEAAGVPLSAVWNPAAPAGTPNLFFPNTLRFEAGHENAGKPFDFFCGGHAFLADGRMLMAGGTRTYPFTGRKEAALFDPETQGWSFVAPMAHGRWYPTLITLGDGRILTVTGLSENGPHNQDLDIYTPQTNTWQTSHFAAGFPGLPLYAHLFLLQDGRIFFSGGRMDDPLQVQPAIFDLTQDPVPTVPVPDLLDPVLRNQSASVLLPPAQDQRVMICGGGPLGPADKTHAVDSVSIVDLKQPNAQYQAAARMCLPRLHLNAVLLPDHTVFVSGGSLQQEDEPLARLQSEVYDPATDSWRLMATATVPRLYHSTAVLLPDGRVIAAAGNPEGGQSVPFVPPDPDEEMRLEVFSPPYLFRGPRPVINNVPVEWNYGQTVIIASPQAGNLRWASIISPGIATHSLNSTQRLVDLDLVSQAGGTVRAKVTNEPNLAPPGWYMLFLVDNDGVPSVAKWIHLT